LCIKIRSSGWRGRHEPRGIMSRTKFLLMKQFKPSDSLAGWDQVVSGGMEFPQKPSSSLTGRDRCANAQSV
jgi:hypothetical protein